MQQAKLRCTTGLSWLWAKASPVLAVVGVLSAIMMYWTLITDPTWGSGINKWMTWVPLHVFNSDMDVTTINAGLATMEEKAGACISLDSLDYAQDDIDASLAALPSGIIKELGSHASVFGKRIKCFNDSFADTLEISQRSGILSAGSSSAVELNYDEFRYVISYHAHVLFQSAVALCSGMGVVECSVLSGLCQVAVLVMLFRALAYGCFYSNSHAVARELWGKLRDAHYKQNFKDAFDDFDQDGNGHITYDELQQAFSKVQPALQEEELLEMIKVHDTNQNGEIEYEEFEEMLYSSMKEADELPSLKSAFKAFDRDENGFTSVNEFRTVMKQLEAPYKCDPTDEDLEAMILMADADSDGHVDYEEFVKMMMQNPAELNKVQFKHFQAVLKYLHKHVQKYRRTVYALFVLFSLTPAICWMQKLISICGAFAEEKENMAEGLNELVRRISLIADDSDFTCDYQTFGLPLVSVVKFVIVDLYNGLSGVGLFGAICALPTLYEYYTAHKEALATEAEKQKEREAGLARDFSELVQFSLCMIQDAVEKDGKTPKLDSNGNPERLFSYTTLFEMKVEDLVKSSPTSLEAVNEAALRTTPEYAFMHTMPKAEWTSVRGFILNMLSEKFSSGYVAEELGIEAKKSKFYFGLANEKPKKGGFTT